MANRAYLYRLSHLPRSYGDRPETVSGLSEWAYGIPLSYRILLSSGTRLCASLISDGLEDDPPDAKTPLWAIGADFDGGLARLEKLLSALAAIAEGRRSPLAALARRLGLGGSGGPAYPDLARAIDDTRGFLAAHRDRHLLLETVELDLMDTSEAEPLRALAEAEAARCQAAGAAVDALPAAPDAAARMLLEAAAGAGPDALGALRGIRLADRFDNTRDGSTEYPLGLYGWTEVLYFGLWNRAQFEEHLASQSP